MPHQNQQGRQPSPAPKLILFLPRSRCSRGCGRTGQSAEMAHLQQRLRPGNELNSSQDAHPMQKPAVKSCHRVEELALAGSSRTTASQRSQNVDQSQGRPSAGACVGGGRPRSSEVLKKTLVPLAKNGGFELNLTPPALSCEVLTTSPSLQREICPSYILSISTSYDFSSLTPFPPFAAV